MDEAAREIRKILAEEMLKGVPLLVFANKQDLPNAMSPFEVTCALQLPELPHNIAWKVFGCSFTENAGDIQAGFAWLGRKILEYQAQKRINEKGVKNWWENLLEPTPAEPKFKLNVRSRSEDDELPYLIRAAAPLSYAGVEPTLPQSGDPTAMMQETVDQLAWANVQSEQLLSEFHECSQRLVDEWNHLLMIRIAFSMLLLRGRAVAKNEFIDGVQKVLNTKKDGTFHLTLTYFWLQVVHFALGSLKGDRPSDYAAFYQLLRERVFLFNQELWLQYYTPHLIFHKPDSMSSFQLPDIKPLPAVLAF
jgi:hypothetical protein